MTKRGTGITTRQMQALPLNALFIWCNNHLDYPKQLQHKINRPDLQVVGPMYVLDKRWQGMVYTGVDYDHAYTSCNGHAPRGLFYDYVSLIRIQK